MNIPDETIVKFKNGTVLHMPFEMYEEISFDKKSITELEFKKSGIICKVKFSFDDVLYVMRTILNASEANQTFKAKIDGKTVSECVFDGITSAVQKSIRDTDVED